MHDSKMKVAYVITQRNGKNHWTRIGVGFVNRDGSINLKLEAVPVTGELQIRDQVPRDQPLTIVSTDGGKNGRHESGALAELG
ncbi:MAG: hypothetical protein IPI67_02540 [Myxococcales bacterium]|nr:hypothetical protein [Myxococcales bacterium]